MKSRYPANGLAVSARRKGGAPLVALAVAVDLPAAGIEWEGGVETDWIGVLEDAPVGAFQFPMAAGLRCVVYGREGSKRPFAVANRLFGAGALEVWIDRPDGLWRICRPVPGEAVFADAGPSTAATVLSAGRAARLARAAA